MIKKAISGFLLSVFGVTIPSLALAEGTPDGLPPPMESVCDSQTGALYGWCTAYCEAMDCDSATPKASQEACQKVADKFTQLSGKTTPCSEPCPLYRNDDFPFFNHLISTPGTITSCTYNWNGNPASLVACSDDPNACNPLSPVYSSSWAAVWQSGSNLFGADYTSGSLFLESDEFTSCKGLLEDAIAMSGVTCAIK